MLNPRVQEKLMCKYGAVRQPWWVQIRTGSHMTLPPTIEGGCILLGRSLTWKLKTVFLAFMLEGLYE